MMLLLLAAEVLNYEWFNSFLLQIMCSCLVNLPPPLTYPPRNKGLIASLIGLIEGNRSEPEVKFEYGPLVRPSDIFSAWVTCNHCGFALWPFAGEMEVPKWDDKHEKPH